MEKEEIKKTIENLKEIRTTLTDVLAKQVKELEEVSAEKDLGTLAEKLKILESRWKQ